MKALLRSWRDSLALLLPRNLKQWVLITFNGTMQTYKVVLLRFWWLLLIIVGLIPLPWYLLMHTYIQYTDWSFQLVRFVGIVSVAVWFFCCVLAARPSVDRKEIRYFASYWKHLLVATFVMALAGGVISAFGALVAFFWVPMLFSLLFLFDTRLSLRSTLMSIWNGLKLTWYTFPLCLLLFTVLQVINVYLIFWLVHRGAPFLLESLLFPLYINMFMYWYITQIHEHPERYQ